MYQLTTHYVLWYDGKSIVLPIGTILELAGKELSKHSLNSPFYYNEDIVRIPNSVIKKVNNG